MSIKTIRWLVVPGIVFLVLSWTTLLAQAAPLHQDVSAGEALFKAKCAACHTIGGGKLVGPDLKGVTQRRDAAWLSAWIKAPDKAIAASDPIAVKLLAEYNNLPMPNLGLSDADVSALIAYFQSKDGSAAAPQNPAASTAPSAQAPVPTPQPPTQAEIVMRLNGDAAYGEALFTGADPLQNGGTHCMACHTVNGVGDLGGGSLGPDLTHVYTRYGRQGLASALGTLPFPTMQGVFANKLLTDSEQADLLAFFEQADHGGQPQTGQNFTVALAGGSSLTLLLLAGMLYFWPRQRMSIAQRLRKNGKL